MYLKNKIFQDLRDIVCDYLMVEALTDIQEQFNALLTVTWITDSEPMDTISLTINDYFQDYTHLHQKQVLFYSSEVVSITKK